MEPRAFLQSLVGLPVWTSFVDPADPEGLVLELGERHRRAARLANPKLSFEQRTFEGEWSLQLGCPWRLLGDRVVASSRALTDALGALNEQPVTQAEISVYGDLSLVLGGLTLEALVLDLPQVVERGARLATRGPRDLWVLSGIEGTLRVTDGGRFEVEPAAEAKRKLRLLQQRLSGDEQPVVLFPGRTPADPD